MHVEAQKKPADRHLHPLTGVRLDPDDRALLDRTAELEKLPRAEVIRRAVREYARRVERRVRR